MRPVDLGWPLLLLVLIASLSMLWVYGIQGIRGGMAAGALVMYWIGLAAILAAAKGSALWRGSWADGAIDDHAWGVAVVTLLVGGILAVVTFAFGLVFLWFQGAAPAVGPGRMVLLAVWNGACVFVLVNLFDGDVRRRRSRS